MKKISSVLITFILSTSCQAKQAYLDQPMYDLNQEKKTFMSEVIPELKNNRIILVGEHHSTQSHHRAQLNVIQALHEAGMDVAIGLEMFRSGSQQALNRWVSGDMQESEFQEIYYKDWNFPWSAYSMIFKYAREKKIPMIGLNVARDITRQVSRHGFLSLSEEKRGKLADVACRVDKEYMDYIRKAYGAHSHGNLNFTYFCEAQLVWDNMMAINALNYLEANPDAVVVILTGTGHAQKAAIPRQIHNRSQLPYAVILPEVSGSLEAETVTKNDADYLMLDL
jgi:uncharacterized iron-regulated protein